MANSAFTAVREVLGTNIEIDSTGGTTPTISIDPNYPGQTSFTELGTIVTGEWEATPVGLQWGGTNATLIASNGGIFYSTATAGAILSGTATANQIIMSGSSAAPSWSTATYPSTTTINQILYSSAANTITGLATSNNGVLLTNGSGVPSIGTATVPVGGTGNTTFTAYSVICAGTTATGAFQNVSGVGSSGQVLTSNGAAALPTWQAGSGGTVTSVSGTALQIDVATGTTTPVISIDAGYVGQASITTLGTISSGTWHGSIITGTYGGTGINNGANTITIGGNISTAGALTLSGAFGATFTFTNTTSVTFPTSGTLATTAGIPSLPLSLSNGGTNASLAASNGGIFYSTASAGAILSGTATANQVLLSGSSTTPAWSTATYPATTTVSQILYSSATNVISGLATANNGVLLTNGSGVPSIGTATVPVGGTGNTTFTAYSVICAGTTATGTFQNVSGVGTSGQVLTSNGASALPTWQAAGDAFAYGNFSSMSSSPPTINQSKNVSSISRSGTGIYVINFTSSYSAATYPVVTGYNRANDSAVGYTPNIYSLATGSFTVSCANSLGTNIDPTNFFFASFGS